MKKSLLILLLVGLLAFSSVRCEIENDDVVDDDESVETEDEGSEEQKEPIVPKSERPDFRPPKLSGPAYFHESFLTADALGTSWKLSKAKKEGADESIAKYDGEWTVEEGEAALRGDLGLHLKSKAKHHAISAQLNKPFKFDGKPLIVQYEVKFENGLECGGGYVKLLSDSSNLDLTKFMDKTPYTIMFGPDKCGQSSKLHFIFRHKNPVTGEYEEKHAKKPSGSFEHVFDKKTHLYRLVVNADNTFEIYIDQTLINSGNLLEDFEPAVNPPKQIVDPEDKKPDDWDEREKIPDPEAKKPDDWDETQPDKIEDVDATMPSGWLEDENQLIPDPKAEKPADWDDDMDGEWEAPMINNPKCESAPGCGKWTRPMIENPAYKGKWKAPTIDNPDYKGKWTPRMIDNPNFFEDNKPYEMTPIAAVGLELWSMSENIVFDNFLITHSKAVADEWISETFTLKHTQELTSSGGGDNVFQWLIKAAEERKWLYAVYIVVVLLPIVLLSVWCCPNSGPGIKAKDIAAAAAKKTDEPTADDDVDDDEDAVSEEKNDSENQTEKPEVADGGGDSKKKASKSALDATNEDVDDTPMETEQDGETTTSTRRRGKAKARKE